MNIDSSHEKQVFAHAPHAIDTWRHILWRYKPFNKVIAFLTTLIAVAHLSCH